MSVSVSGKSISVVDKSVSVVGKQYSIPGFDFLENIKGLEFAYSHVAINEGDDEKKNKDQGKCEGEEKINDEGKDEEKIKGDEKNEDEDEDEKDEGEEKSEGDKKDEDEEKAKEKIKAKKRTISKKSKKTKQDKSRKIKGQSLIMVTNPICQELTGVFNQYNQDYSFSDIISIIAGYASTPGAKVDITTAEVDVDALIGMSTASMVGKNSNTVLDESVRSSKEISSKYFQLSPYLEDALEKETKKMYSTISGFKNSTDDIRSALNNYRLKIVPHKLIMYSPGDFFDIHQDSLHDLPRATKNVKSGSDGSKFDESKEDGDNIESKVELKGGKKRKMNCDDSGNNEIFEVSDDSGSDEVSNKNYDRMNTMNLTLSVDIKIPRKDEDESAGYWGSRLCYGGNLYIKMANYSRSDYNVRKCGATPIPDDFFEVPSVEDSKGNLLRCALFYHDVPHCISTLEKGSKLSLTCDVVLEPICSVDKDITQSPQNISRLLQIKRRKVENDEKKGISLSSILSKLPKGISMINFESYIEGMKKILSSGMPRAGFFLRHSYFGGLPSSMLLKGYDKILYELMALCCSDIEIIPISSEDDNVYHSGVFKIFECGSTFHKLYHECEDEEGDEGDEDDEDENSDGENNNGDEDDNKEEKTCIEKKMDKEETKDKEDAKDKEESKEKIQSISPSSYMKKIRYERCTIAKPMEINFDTYGNFETIAQDRKYRLGDVAFVHTFISNETKEYKGDEEIHLGNEGFNGEIFSCVAIVGTIDLSLIDDCSSKLRI